MENTYQTSTIQPTVSIGNWFLSLILTMIPIVNIIMLFVWAFSHRTNPTKANWAKAALIIMAIWIVLGLLFGGYFVRMFYSNYPGY